MLFQGGGGEAAGKVSPALAVGCDEATQGGESSVLCQRGADQPTSLIDSLLRPRDFATKLSSEPSNDPADLKLVPAGRLHSSEVGPGIGQLARHGLRGDKKFTIER